MGLQLSQPSARAQNGGLRMLAQMLPKQDIQPKIIDGPKRSLNINSLGFIWCSTEAAIRPSPCPYFFHFGWSAVSSCRPAGSQSDSRSGRQGKRKATRSHLFLASTGENGEHWTLMATATGATLDQAGCIRTSASASHNPYSHREAHQKARPQGHQVS
jgi:hypothetical protein